MVEDAAAVSAITEAVVPEAAAEIPAVAATDAAQGAADSNKF